MRDSIDARRSRNAQRVGIPATQLRVVVTLGFCGLVSAADNWFVSPALPAIAHTLAVAPTVAAIILTAYLLPYGALQPVCGRLGDGVGRLRLLRIIVLGLCVGTLLCAIAPSLGALVAARVVTGCFAAGIISVSQAFVGDVVDREHRAGAVGILMGITFTGQGLSAGLGGILTDLVGWRAAFAAFGVLAFVAWLGLFALREPSGSSSISDGEEEPASGASPVLSFFRDALRIFFGPCRVVFFLACTTGLLFLGTYGLMGTFLSEVCGLSPTQAGLVMMLYGVFCLIGGAISGRLGAGRGLAHVIAIGEISGVVSALALLVSTRNWSHAGTSERHVLSLGELRLLFHSVRYVSADVSGLGTYEQTERAFKEHVGWLQQYGLNLKDHCQRTWIYVRDIDRHYAPMVKARNAFFEENDLTPRTHFIASTGIEGYSLSPAATVAVDFFSVSGLDDGRILYLQAPEFLNPTYEYGVAFERGTRLSLPHGDLFLISGTASIDKHGVCLYPGDVVRQLDRLFLNIDALLRSGEAEMRHLRSMTVYLRDVSDYETVERYMQAHFPSVSYVITSARVCRPEWLVEVEAVGWKAIE